MFATTNGSDHLQEIKALYSTSARRTSSSGSRTRASELAEFFVDVELERYPGGLEVTEAAPVLAFVRSMDHGIRDGANKAIAREIERHGVFRVTKSAGLFRLPQTLTHLW